MKREHYSSLLLIGIGFYFFITQFNHPVIGRLNTWSVLVIAVGIFILFTYMKTRNKSLLTQGLTILLIGFHFYALEYIPNWIDHWAMFPFTWGLALFISYVFTRKHLLQSLALILVSLLFIFSEKLPGWFPSIAPIENEIIDHWPLLLIGLGFILYLQKRN